MHVSRKALPIGQVHSEHGAVRPEERDNRVASRLWLLVADDELERGPCFVVGYATFVERERQMHHDVNRNMRLVAHVHRERASSRRASA